MKEHRSHDVLPLCTSCHQRSNLYDNALKQHYAKKCDAPMATEKGLKYHMDLELRAVSSAARFVNLVFGDGSEYPSRGVEVLRKC